MIDNLLIFPLHYDGPNLTPEDFFLLTFWTLFLPMFVATVGVFLSRRIALNIKLSDSVKMILPLLYAGLFWGIVFLSLDMIRAVTEFISSLIYGRHGIWYGNEFIIVFIFSVLPVLGFLQARLSYPKKDRLYTVVFAAVVVALWALVATLYENIAGFGMSVATSTSILSIIGILVSAVTPITYFFFLAYIYRRSSDSEDFLYSVLRHWILVTVIYSPLLFWLFLALLELLL